MHLGLIVLHPTAFPVSSELLMCIRSSMPVLWAMYSTSVPPKVKDWMLVIMYT